MKALGVQSVESRGAVRENALMRVEWSMAGKRRIFQGRTFN